MVLQSDFNDTVLAWLTSATYTADIGESSTALFTDNALDVVHVTKSGINISAEVIGQDVKMTTRLVAGDAIGDDINAILFKFDGVALDLSKHTLIEKTDSIVVDYEAVITMFIE